MGWLPGSGCVLWLQMDERKGNIAYDLSGYGNHGTRYGASWARGKIGYCLKFDGVDDYVEVPDDDSLRPSSFTVSFWFKPASWTAWVWIINKRYGDINGWSLGWKSTNEIWFVCWGKDGSVSLSPPKTLSMDTWYHIAGVYSDDPADRKATLYVNSELIGSGASLTDTFQPSTQPLLIMRRAANYLAGLSDEVRFYNRVLTAEEIKAHYWYGIIPSLRVPPVAVR